MSLLDAVLPSAAPDFRPEHRYDGPRQQDPQAEPLIREEPLCAASVKKYLNSPSHFKKGTRDQAIYERQINEATHFFGDLYECQKWPDEEEEEINENILY